MGIDFSAFGNNIGRNKEKYRPDVSSYTDNSMVRGMYFPYLAFSMVILQAGQVREPS